MGLLLTRYSEFFNAHKLGAAASGIVTATGISFSLSRWWVWHHREGRPDAGAPPLSAFDPVSPGGLGSQETGVGAGEQALGALTGLEASDTATGAHGSPERRDGQAVYPQSQSLGERQGTGQVG